MVEVGRRQGFDTLRQRDGTRFMVKATLMGRTGLCGLESERRASETGPGSRRGGNVGGTNSRGGGSGDVDPHHRRLQCRAHTVG